MGSPRTVRGGSGGSSKTEALLHTNKGGAHFSGIDIGVPLSLEHRPPYSRKDASRIQIPGDMACDGHAIIQYGIGPASFQVERCHVEWVGQEGPCSFDKRTHPPITIRVSSFSSCAYAFTTPDTLTPKKADTSRAE